MNRKTLIGLACFISLFILGLSPGLAQQQDRPIVRLIYFLPSDREFQPDIDAKLDALIKSVQQFYADEMERHGFGRS